jgi:hypothetical protein
MVRNRCSSFDLGVGSASHAFLVLAGARTGKGALGDSPRSLALDRGQAMTRQQEPRVLIGDGEGTGPDSVARRDWPLKSAVQRSFGACVIGGTTPGCWWGRRRRRLVTKPCRARRSPAVLAAGHLRSGISGCRGPSQSRSFAGPQSGYWFRASTISVATAGGMRCGHECGARLRSPRLRRPSASKRASHFVAGLATDRVPGAEVRHRLEIELPIGDKVVALFHGGGLQPRHRPSQSRGRRCSLSGVSPMFPVYSVTDVPGLCPLGCRARTPANVKPLGSRRA